MNFKKTGIVIGSVVVVLYVLFLSLPFMLSGVVDSYRDDISKIVEESSGFKLEMDKLRLLTTPKLTAGVGVGHVSVKLPSGEEFFTSDGAEFKVSLLPLLIGRIEADVIKADSLSATLKVCPDGTLLLEKSLPQKEDENETEISAPVTSLPFGFRLSNHLPNISVKNYRLALVDMRNEKVYAIDGKDLKVSDFILDKKVKVSSNGKVNFDGEIPFNYDLKVYNKIMPDLELNDMVFAQGSVQKEEVEPIAFNVIDVLEGIRKNQLAANLRADVKTFGKADDAHITGLVDLENITLAVNGKKLPEGHVKLDFNGKKLVSDVLLYTADNESTSILGEFKGGKAKNLNLAFKSNAQINNIFNIIKSVASSFNYNDLQSLTASGNIDADFSVKSNLKKITSNGYFKIPSAVIKYPLYNVMIDKINADVDFSNDAVNFKNVGFTVFSQPLKFYGTIKNDASTDLHLIADKLLIKGLVAASGQVGLLKDNDFKSGTLSVDASLKGKLKALEPVVDVSVDNVNVYNKPSLTSVLLEGSKIKLTSDGKVYKGDIAAQDLKVNNPLAAFKLPKINITLDEKDINIADTYLMFDNSKIDISGLISEYTSKKMKMNFKAKGNILANDLKRLLPVDLQSMVTVKGAMPLLVTVSGNDKAQSVDLRLLATQNGYFHIADVAALKGKSTFIRSNITISNNSAKFKDTGLYSTSLTAMPEGVSVSGLSGVVGITGEIVDFTNPEFSGFNISTNNVQTVSIPGFEKSSADVDADINFSGKLATPSMKGRISANKVLIPSMQLSLKDVIADINNAGISVNLPLIQIANSTMSAKTLISNNFTNGIVLKSLDFNADLIDADTLSSALAGGSTSSSTVNKSSNSSASTSQNLGIVIQNGKAVVTKFKTGKIVATSLTSDFGLKNNVFYLKNLKGDAFNGKIDGNINCNVISGSTSVDMAGQNMNAVSAIEAAAGIPNALSGVLGFDADLRLNAFATDFNAMLKSITGSVSFDVKDGHYANIGRLDNLLLAQNLAANAILKAALAPVRNMPVVQNASNFKLINGSLTLANGIANLKSIKSSGPSMAYFVTGQYNIINGYTNVVILGRLGADVISALGPLGQLSVSKLTSYLPKFGTQTVNILNSLTSNPKNENIAQIPSLSGNSQNAKDFKVIFNGSVTNPASIRSFKWLSDCDTSAISGGSFTEQLKQSTENLKNAGKNNIQDMKKGVENVKESAKNTAEDIKNQVQKTKESIQELKNLKNIFKKPATTESSGASE